MSKTGWIIFSVVVVLVLGGLVTWTRITNPPIDLSNVENNSIIAASDQNGNIGDHIKGSDSGAITLIEYGDFQCPSCGAAHPNLNMLMEEYGDDVTFIYRNFPLTTIHPNAKAAAAAAEAAGLQDKYWEMYDKLFENQGDWQSLDPSQRTDRFKQYAVDLNLDAERFMTDFASSDVNQKLRFDMELAGTVNVSATPTFFLNGEQLDEATASGITQGDLTAIRAELDALVSDEE